jgi:ligand-binding sensor domain-containing protein
VVLYSLVPSLLAQTRHPSYIRYGVEDGLPDKELFCVTKDKDGFVWFGTDNGVARFDGNNMQPFHFQDGLLDKAFLQIYQDRQGRLWFFSSTGRVTIRENDRFYSGQGHKMLRNMHITNTVLSVLEDDGGNIYLGSMSGVISHIDPEGHFTESENPGVPKWVIALKKDPQKGLLAGFVENLHFVIDSVDCKSQLFCSPPTVVPQNDNYPFKGFFHSNGEFWASTGRSLLVMRPDKSVQTIKLDDFGITSGKIVYLGETSSGKVWVGTTRGAFLYANSQLHKGPERHVLPEDEVRYVLDEGADGIWMATTNGAVYFPNLAIQLVYESAGKGLDGEIVGFQPIDGDGFLLANDETGFVHLDAQLNLKQAWPASMREYDNPRTIHRLQDGSIYATADQGMLRWKEGTLVVSQPYIFTDFENLKDSLCICATFGWYIVDPRKEHMRQWDSKDMPVRKSKQPQRCFQLTVDRQSRLWVANALGVFYVENGQINAHPQGDVDQTSRVVEMAPDPVSGIWLATNGRGLIYLHPKGMFGLDEADGLASNQVNNIHISPDGTLWLGTTKGISRVRVDRRRLSCRIDNLRREAGLPSHSVSQVIAYRDSLIATIGSQVLAMPQYLFDQPVSPPTPKLLQLYVMGQDCVVTDSLVLLFRHNSIVIRYTAIGYKSGDNIRYRYRLRPGEEAWTPTANGEISLAALASGNYQFELQAKALGSDWSTETATLSFVVLRPYWQRSWILWVLIISFIGTFSLIFWGFSRQSKRRNERRRRLVQAEHRALVAQMNPHFISNSLQSIQSYFINRDLETANDYMADFGELMRSILDSSRTYCTTLSSELRLIQLYLQMEQMRTSDAFSFEIVVDPAIQAERFLLPPLLLQPFLENAIWHGIVPKSQLGKINIYIDPVEDAIRVVVNDDGIGRKQSLAAKAKQVTTRKSHATDIVRERLELLNQRRKVLFKFWIVDREDANGQPLGTTVIFLLPNNFKEPHDQNHPH